MSLIEDIKGQNIGRNEAIIDTSLAMVNLRLKQASLPRLPDDFASLLKDFNGLSNEGSLVFGANIESTLFKDLIKFNTAFFKSSPSNILILGYDELNYLIWNSGDVSYQIVDRDTFDPNLSSPTLADAVKHLLRIE